MPAMTTPSNGSVPWVVVNPANGTISPDGRGGNTFSKNIRQMIPRYPRAFIVCVMHQASGRIPVESPPTDPQGTREKPRRTTWALMPGLCSVVLASEMWWSRYPRWRCTCSLTR